MTKQPRNTVRSALRNALLPLAPSALAQAAACVLLATVRHPSLGVRRAAGVGPEGRSG